MRPPTKTCPSDTKPQKSLKDSVQCLLQLLHGINLDSLGSRFGLEDARFLGEWVDALLCKRGSLLLQLQVEHACQFETAVFLDLTTCDCHESLHDAFCLLCLRGHKLEKCTVCTPYDYVGEDPMSSSLQSLTLQHGKIGKSICKIFSIHLLQWFSMDVARGQHGLVTPVKEHQLQQNFIFK